MSTRANPVFATDPGNVWLDILEGSTRWDSGAAALTTIEVFGAGNQFVDFEGRIVASFEALPQEEAAALTALALIENIINVRFVEAVNFNDADIFLAHIAGSNWSDPSVLGTTELPGTNTNPVTGDAQSGVFINYSTYQPTNYSSLAQGGYDFITYIHEFGHALGLRHPHGLGNAFPGVTAASGDYGDLDMNQGIFTMMSYNDGFKTGPLGPLEPTSNPLYGWEGTPMALDIAALQHLYGANMSFRTGDDTYVLPSVNAAGAFYSCLWDAGGNDTIVNPSGFGAYINLRAATLLYELGGGGFLSTVIGIHGGFTIANRVIIENAIGGAGEDLIYGNQVGNVLSGNGGNDILYGDAGQDLLDGGGGTDWLEGGSGNDTYIVGSRRDTVIEVSGGGIDTVQSSVTRTLGAQQEKLTLTGTLAINGTGNGLANTLTGNTKSNILNGAAGNDVMRGLSGNDTYVVGSRLDTVIEAAGGGTDTVQSSVTRVLGAQQEKLTLTGALAINGTGNGLGNTLTGNSAANVLNGAAGNDIIAGLGGNDTMTGGLGADSFRFDTALSGASNRDTVSDFTVVDDTMQLENAVFTGLATGLLSAGRFHIGASATEATHRIVYNAVSGNLFFDADGLGGGAQIRFAILDAGLALKAGDFFVV